MSRSSTLPPAQTVAELVHKLNDADHDIRYMSLSDLHGIFTNPTSSSFLAQDYNACARLVDGLLHTLVDPNGEVQNMTVQCLGPLVQRVAPNILAPMIHKFATLENADSIDITLSALAVRTMVVSLPRPISGTPRTSAITNAHDAVSKVLVPRLVGYIVIPRKEKDLPDPPKGSLVEDLEKGRDSNAIDVLTELARCFGPMLQPAEVKALQDITLKVLESDRAGSAMKKKAVVALSTLSHFFSEDLLSAVISHLIESLRDPHLTSSDRRLIITVFGSMARAIPTKFGGHLKTLAPFVIAALSQQELDEQMQGAEEDEERDPQADEVREAALSALEAFISSSPREMDRYMPECIDAILRFLKYDPGYLDDDDAEGEDSLNDDEEDFELDEDFEEEVGADDEDDVSWKVRRASAKALYTIVSVRGRELLENGPAYDRVAHAMIARFKEREETVRVEVLTTLGFLVRKTGGGSVTIDAQLATGVEQALALQPQTRKRRRTDSDVSMSDPRKFGRFTGSLSPEHHSPPPAGPQASLAKLGAEMANGLLKLLKTSTPTTKQLSLSVLKDLVVARQGGFDQTMGSVLPPLIETIETPGSTTKSTGPALPSGSGSTTTATLQVEALQLLSEILKAHSSKLFQPHLQGIVRALVKSISDRSPKVASEGLSTVEQLVKALTPPRSASVNQQNAAHVEQVLKALLEQVTSRNVDLGVKKDAIQVLGILLGRTFGAQGAKLLPAKRRVEALDVLYDASRNETTRYAAIKSIDAMAAQGTSERVAFDSAWVSKVCLELGAQLRKADRALRGASLAALRTIVADSGAGRSIDESSEKQLLSMLIPLLTSDDLHMTGPALVVMAAIVASSPRNVTTQELIDHICSLTTTNAASSVIGSLSSLVEAIGVKGTGQPLMQKLLQDVGIKASSAVVGKLIGTLVVSGGGSVGIKTADFLKEVKQAPDDQRRSLALAVLGEIGLRSGASAGLSTDLFIDHFSSKTPEVSLAAANALGRAAAGPGNVKSWVPAILTRIKQHPEEQYLALHAIRELLQHNENDKEIVPFASTLWDSALSASREKEDNRALGAECIANLVMIDPPTFLTALQSLLADSAATVRSIAILAFRDVFTATDSTYDKDLRPIMVELLTTMLRDSDVENRRTALNTFAAAVRNKPHLIMPHLTTLMPLVLDQSIKDPSLIREVSMGPFKHTVDDGLETRKNAYETLYSLMEIAPTRILDSTHVSTLFDRTIAGAGDDRGIQILSNLMLPKLAAAAPEEMVRRLDSLAEQFRTVLAFKPKDTAVRPEIEKADEAKRGVIKVTLELGRLFPQEVPAAADGKTGSSVGATTAGAASTSNRPVWSGYWEYMMANHAEMVKAVEKEVRESGRAQ